MELLTTDMCYRRINSSIFLFTFLKSLWAGATGDRVQRPGAMPHLCALIQQSDSALTLLTCDQTASGNMGTWKFPIKKLQILGWKFNKTQSRKEKGVHFMNPLQDFPNWHVLERCIYEVNANKTVLFKRSWWKNSYQPCSPWNCLLLQNLGSACAWNTAEQQWFDFTTSACSDAQIINLKAL